MKTATIELSYDTLDKLVKEQLEGWAEHFKAEADGTADWWVHPEDKERAYSMYAALKTVLELFNE